MSREAILRLIFSLGLVTLGIVFYLVTRPTPDDVTLRLLQGTRVLCPPGGQINIQWSSGGQPAGCTTGFAAGVACRRAALTTTPDIFHVSGTHDRAMGGNQPLTITQSVAISYTVYEPPFGWPATRRTLNIEVPDSPSLFLLQGDIQPACMRTRPGSADFAIGSLPGGVDSFTGFNFGYATVDRQPAAIPVCVGSPSICNRGRGILRVQGLGRSGTIEVTLEPGRCTDEFRGVNPAYISIGPADRDEAASRGGSCIHQTCNYLGQSVCRFPDGEYAYSLEASCLRPDQYALSPYEAECQRVANSVITSASEPLIYEQDVTTTPVTPDLVSICDLKTSCGNQVCDKGCEDAKSCAADCSPVTTTPDQKPDFTQEPLPPTEPPTDEPTPVVTEAVTETPGVCEPGWVPVDACVCCGPNRVCPDHVEVNHSDCVNTGGGSTGGNTGGGGKQPVCGDGVCDKSEKGCGVCTADCGPC